MQSEGKASNHLAIASPYCLFRDAVVAVKEDCEEDVCLVLCLCKADCDRERRHGILGRLGPGMEVLRIHFHISPVLKCEYEEPEHNTVQFSMPDKGAFGNIVNCKKSIVRRISFC